jgi:hypothetical protein
MKAELLSLFTAIAFSTSPVLAQSKLQIVDVGQVLTNPDQYRGKIVALHGIVEKVALEQKTFTVVDSKLSSGTGGTNAHSLSATIQGGSQVDIPKPGQEAVAIGQIENKSGVANFSATQVFTNKDEVRQILTQGSIRRKPGKRPGDNLGRDAQPGKNSQ